MLEPFLLAAGIPAALGLVAALGSPGAAAGARGAGAPPGASSLALPAAIGISALLAHVLLVGWPSWPPASAAERIFLLSAATTIATLALPYLPPGGRWIATLGPAVLVPILVRPPGSMEGGLRSALVATALAAGAFAFRASLVAAARRPGPTGTVVLAASAVGISALLAATASAFYGQIAGAVAAASGAAALVGWLRSDAGASDLGAAAAAPILAGLLLAGVLFGDTPPAAAGIAAFAPLAGALAARGGGTPRAASARAGLASAAVAAAAIVASQA